MDQRTSVVAGGGLAGPRSVKDVPFVELFGGRVQGVVSSGSDVERVYVAFVEAGSGDYYCCTNNNRPCGGLRGSPCKHIVDLVDEALAQFGGARVAAYLGVPDAPSDKAYALIAALHGAERKEPPGPVFSRFLDYLRYCEFQARPGTILEMGWFVS